MHVRKVLNDSLLSHYIFFLFFSVVALMLPGYTFLKTGNIVIGRWRWPVCKIESHFSVQRRIDCIDRVFDGRSQFEAHIYISFSVDSRKLPSWKLGLKEVD